MSTYDHGRDETSSLHAPMTVLHLLFVCSRNQWRSPTAEAIYARREGVRVRSRGVAASARRRLTAADLVWADLVFVMEECHADRIEEAFPAEARSKRLLVLDIPDEFRFMDPELVEMISQAVEPTLATHGADRS